VGSVIMFFKKEVLLISDLIRLFIIYNFRIDIKKLRGVSLIALLSVLIPQLALANSDRQKESISAHLNSIQNGSGANNFSVPTRQLEANNIPNIDQASRTSLLAPLPLAPIIGGTNANRGEYLEYSLVILTDGNGNITGLCGGTLISSNTVLTAAHCAQNRARTYFVVPEFYSFFD